MLTIARKVNAIVWGIDRNEDAVKILIPNKEEYPESVNTNDSYGAALLAIKDTTSVIQNFKKALAMAFTFTASLENDQN